MHLHRHLQPGQHCAQEKYTNANANANPYLSSSQWLSRASVRQHFLHVRQVERMWRRNVQTQRPVVGRVQYGIWHHFNERGPRGVRKTPRRAFWVQIRCDSWQDTVAHHFLGRCWSILPVHAPRALRTRRGSIALVRHVRVAGYAETRPVHGSRLAQRRASVEHD